MSQSKMSDTYTIVFMVVLCSVCGLILSFLASGLREPQERAKILDQNKQMMIAAGVFTHGGYFVMQAEDGKSVPAKHAGNGVLIAGTADDRATEEDLLTVHKRRFKAFLTDNSGNVGTFEQANIVQADYMAANAKTGFNQQPFKLVYQILTNPDTNGQQAPEGYVLPVNGFGLWDGVYGYLALKTDGVHIIGTSWYWHRETPGLGSNIAEGPWQSQFPGKKIVPLDDASNIDLTLVPIGLNVVRGKVAEVFPNSQKANNAVDGMAGATLTGNGVTKAYKDALTAYRPFLVKLYQAQPRM